MVQIVEERKSHSVGGGDENSAKNRCESVIPFDRNRVILTPIPSREHSTYINASFIEVNTTLSTVTINRFINVLTILQYCIMKTA